MAEIDSGRVCRVAVHIELLRIRTASQIEDVPDADLWVMDREMQYFDAGKALTDNALYRVRGVSGVRWAVPLYKGIARALAPDGKFRQVVLLGIDDASLVGAPRKMLLGRYQTERTLYAAQTELARGERAVGQDLVRMYKALGGGWDHKAAQAQALQSP